MNMKKTNPLALRSKEELAQGLLSLMELHPYREITVTQICQEAKLVRKTFYRNFQSKDDILNFVLERLLYELYDSLDLTKAIFVEEMLNCFQFFYDNRKLLALLKANSLLYLFSEKTIQYLKDTTCANQASKSIREIDMEDYFINFIASAITATVGLWIEKGFDRTPEELALFTFKALGGDAHNPPL